MSETDIRKLKIDQIDHEIKTKEAILITLRADIRSKQSYLDTLKENVNKKFYKTFIFFKEKF